MLILVFFSITQTKKGVECLTTSTPINNLIP